jgi:hypothetical protein
MAKVKVTICDVLRRIIRESPDPDARMWAAEAQHMARKIVDRLILYKSMKCPHCGHQMKIDTTDKLFDEYDDNIFKKIGRKIIGKKDPKGD